MQIRKVYSFFFLLLSVCVVACNSNSSPLKAGDIRKNGHRNFLQEDNFKLATVSDLQQLFTFTDNAYPLVSAHRGGASKGYPENAIETFQNVSNTIPVIIECDVRITKDSVLILMHDEDLDRTTTGKGDVDAYNLDDLKKLFLKDTEGEVTKYKIPTLEEALLWGKGKVVFTLDVKREVPYKMVSDIIEKTKANSYAIVITYNANQARTVYNINPDLVISASVKTEGDFRRLIEIGIPDTRIVAFVGTTLPEADLIELLHNHGIKTILGTMGNLDRKAQRKGYQMYADFVAQGIDVISTDYPLEANKALDYYIRKRKLSSPYINN